MKQTKQFLRPLLMAIVMLVGMLVPQGAWAQITFITESGDEIWCEDIYVALNTLRNESWMLGDGPVTMRFDSDIALSEELDCQYLGRDITIDLNGHVLTNTNEPWVVGSMRYIVAFCDCEYRITIQNGTIESNELDAIYFRVYGWNLNQKLILKNVKVVTHQEGRHCLFDAMSWDWEDWGNYELESSPKLQIIDSEFHSNGCSAISFTFQRNDEYVKSILPEGYSFYNANTDVELAEYADRPFVDENGNPATDIRTGVSQDLPKIKISDPYGYEYYCGNFKQAMDIYGSYGMTLTLLDDVKEGLCTTNNNYMSVTIDLNGHTLDITHLYTYGGEYLNIIDSSEGKTGKLIAERFYVDTPAENNAVIEGNVITRTNDCFTNNGLVEYVDGGFINNGDFITSWTWADDHSSATLRINHEDVDAVVTNEVTTPATCIASGVRTYTAAATYRDKNYADTKDEEIAIDPNAHDYQVQLDENENPVFVWSEDYTTATLQVVCSHNAEHTANVEVTGEDITSAVTTPATCTAVGVRTYTAKATYAGEEYTGTAIVATEPIAEHTLDEHNVCTGCGHGFIFFEKERSYDIEPNNRYAFSNSEGSVEYIGNTTFNEWMCAFEFSGLVTEIGDRAFTSREALTAIYLPEVTTIGEEAFWGCGLRDNVSLPKATTIGQAAFLGCGFQTLSLPEATTIGYAAFGACMNLSSIELPKATTIEDNAFMECDNLKSITVACAANLSGAEIPEDATITRVHDFSSKTLTDEPDADGLYAYACDRGCGAHSDDHIVKGDGDGNTIALTANTDGETTTYTAADVTIEDGKAFSTPVAFTAPSDQVTVERTFTARKPATVMLPFSIEASLVQGATFSEFGGVSYDAEKAQWVATMTEVETTLLAYKPYIVMLDEGNETGKVTFGNTSADVATFAVTPEASAMQTADENGWTFKAVNANKTWAEDDPELGKAYGFAGQSATYDGYSVAQGEFIKVGAGATAAPGRCYLIKENADWSHEARRRAVAAEELPSSIKVRFINGEATGIATLNTETGEFTLEGWYDLNGRKINAPAKGGIYVKDGKKMLVK